MRITATKSQTLIDFLLEQYSDSPRTRIKKLLQNGTIRVNNKPVTHHSFQINAGDTVDLSLHPGVAMKAGLPFKVLFEDQHLMVIDKPPGIATSSVDGSNNVQRIVSETLRDKSKGKIRTFVVHRLDKEVSGVLLLAKTEAAMDLLKDHWEETGKHYYALVEGTPSTEEGTIESWLKEDNKMKVHSVKESPEAKFAVTHYTVIRKVTEYTLLDVKTDTGRKNQIRVHLSDIGCPIVGDRKYGASDEYFRRVRLHAFSISFPHPITGKRITIESPMPKGFLSVKPGDEKYK